MYVIVGNKKDNADKKPKDVKTKVEEAQSYVNSLHGTLYRYKKISHTNKKKKKILTLKKKTLIFIVVHLKQVLQQGTMYKNSLTTLLPKSTTFPSLPYLPLPNHST